MMTAREWCALAHLPKLGARRLAVIRRELAAQGLADDWPEAWLAAMPAGPRDTLRHWLDHPAKSPLEAPVAAALEWEASQPSHHLLYPGHPAWPALLDEIVDPPALLWAKGDLGALELPGLAMVGTRRPTREGSDNAAFFARELVEAGFSIVSGMALGVDGVAQRTALDAGGRSVAVLGCGVDVIYPPRHAGLYRRLLDEGGLLLSEHPAETRAHARYFPRRNRIITGLSLGVLVVEAAEKSGSLVSARLAMEQNREVFAIPGSLHNVQARGNLGLIRDGASLVCGRDDILEQLGHWQALNAARPEADTSTLPVHAEAPAPSDVSQDPLLALLDTAPTPLDVLVERSELDVGGCQMRLLELELAGQAAQVSGGWVRRATR
ncbi:DNA-processing protein DprA [Chromohalobacter beijerinckii]|uniref:DNA-processing protein DprA n=1 Tax=Chromohalobacter beijerinckii TaxID=86179 RepID=A0ABV8XHL9_9GAMM|nr:DNA-processing protein DprA [Chromohalobacter beijerinckii]MCK0764796.1 DNA-processing protein DprA [Chromohalobacter beijerinckii]